MNKRIPAYPLFVNDPFFSIWSPSDTLNGADTCFWTGLERKTYGLVVADGKVYSFMGKTDGAEVLKQASVKLNAFTTDYTFTCDVFTLDVSFISPLLPTDYELLSRPVCYMTYKVTPKITIKEIKVAIALHEEHCYNKCDDTVIGGGFKYPDYELAFFGRNRQLPMSNSFDSVAADWGFTYISADQAFFTDISAFNDFVKTGEERYSYTEEDKKVILGVNYTLEGKFLVAFDDLVSIFYYGEWLKGYYFRNGKTIFDAIEEAYYGFDETMKKLNKFSSDLDDRLSSYDDDYRLLCMAALRQTMGAHKLVENKEGNILFLSKECHSNGCIATVDITYPSMPLFLLYNPELILGMLRPVFEFARMPVWEGCDYAPHDCGTYPYVFGQMYAVRHDVNKNDKFLSNSFRRNRWNGIIVTHPHVYNYPAHANIYDFDHQMPIEECGNMLICSYAAITCGADEGLIRDNYDLLSTWFRYLRDNGLVPTMQLCTDDFAERIDENVNLSIKAIVAIKCYALLAKRFGFEADRADAEACLDRYRREFYDKYDSWDHQPLSYNTDIGTYSLKYNMAYDVLFEFGIFSETMREKEIACYLRNNKHLGVPLDNRSDLTKTDWILHTCALTDSREKQRELYSSIANLLNEAPERVPFTDLYHVDTGIKKDFQNRAVQGGIFILLLKDELRKQKNR